MTEAASESGGDDAPWWLGLAALLIADTAYGFQQTAITPALPVVQHDLSTSREWTTWLFSGYFIVASVAPVFLGKLADRSGKRRIYLAALTVFLAGSIGAALAPSIQVLLLCRVVQGVGGVVFPLSFSILRDQVSPRHVSAGIGALTAGFGVGALLGFAVGGALTQYLSWRWVFGVGAIVLALAIALVVATTRATPPVGARRLDTPGAALFGGAMAALIIALTEGPQSGWGSGMVIGMFAASAAAAGGWLVRELHTPEPLVDLRVLSSRPVLLTNVISLLGGYAALGMTVLLPYLLEGRGASLTAFGLSAGPLLTGIVLLPRAIGQAVGGPVIAPLARLLSAGRAFAVGMLFLAGAALGLALWRDELWMVLLELAALGLGFGMTISIGGSIVTLAASAAETATATSINSVLRRVGGAIGAQVAVALLAAITLHGGAPAPAAFTTAFLVAAGVALTGATCALFVRPEPAD